MDVVLEVTVVMAWFVLRRLVSREYLSVSARVVCGSRQLGYGQDSFFSFVGELALVRSVDAMARSTSSRVMVVLQASRCCCGRDILSELAIGDAVWDLLRMDYPVRCGANMVGNSSKKSLFPELRQYQSVG